MYGQLSLKTASRITMLKSFGLLNISGESEHYANQKYNFTETGNMKHTHE